MIREISKGLFQVLTADGKKVLGTHKSKEDAVKQLQAIEASRAKQARGNVKGTSEGDSGE